MPVDRAGGRRDIVDRIEHMFDNEGAGALVPPETGIPPGSALAGALERVTVAELDGFALVEVIRGCERLASWAAALQAEAILGLLEPSRSVGRAGVIEPGAGTEPGGVNEFAADEVASALAIGRRSAQRRVEVAHGLVRHASRTLEALRRGEIDPPKAREIVDGLIDLDVATAAAVESRVLLGAGSRTPGQLRAHIERIRIAADPSSARARHERKVRERRVELWPDADGMAALHAVLSAENAAAIHEALTRQAKAIDSPGDPRGLDARRADAFVGMFLRPVMPAPRDPSTPPPSGEEVRAIGQVQVTVAATTLLGLDEEPGVLAGYGPITADVAREIAENSTWRRILTDPASGAVLDVGRRSYRPPEELARHVRARDATCRFPGCRAPARRCDLDHTVPFPKGPTAEHNLGALCRHHHRLKHGGDWTVTQSADGTFIWTSPTGHTYTTVPPPPSGQP